MIATTTIIISILVFPQFMMQSDLQQIKKCTLKKSQNPKHKNNRVNNLKN